MAGIPRYRAFGGPALFSAGFRPFFLAAAIWAAVAIPIWLAAYAYGAIVPSNLPPMIWHPHEMIFGFAAAAVAGFLLTAIPNWTGRMPLVGRPLLGLLGLWALGRAAVLFSAIVGAPAAAMADLAFPTIFLGVIAREIFAGRNWRNLPMLVALSLLLIGNLLVHFESLGLADTAALGNRLGIATLSMLIALVGGRLIPSFTRNWLTKVRPEVASPSSGTGLDVAALGVTGLALATWTIAPVGHATPWALLAGGIATLLRLTRWRGVQTRAEPLLVILHLGYGWLAGGLLLMGVAGIDPIVPPAAALHALTVGAVGTMTLAVMTRASLGHTGRELSAGPATKMIYLFVTIAAILRVLAPFAGAWTNLVLMFAGAAWSSAFGLFAIRYGRLLARPRATEDEAERLI